MSSESSEDLEPAFPWRLEWRQVRRRRTTRQRKQATDTGCDEAFATCGQETAHTVPSVSSATSSALAVSSRCRKGSTTEESLAAAEHDDKVAQRCHWSDLLPKQLCACDGWEVAVKRTFISVSESDPRTLRSSASSPGRLEGLELSEDRSEGCVVSGIPALDVAACDQASSSCSIAEDSTSTLHSEDSTSIASGSWGGASGSSSQKEDAVFASVPDCDARCRLGPQQATEPVMRRTGWPSSARNRSGLRRLSLKGPSQAEAICMDRGSLAVSHSPLVAVTCPSKSEVELSLQNGRFSLEATVALALAKAAPPPCSLQEVVQEVKKTALPLRKKKRRK
eukprot:TRINITY_DN80613_c0_g1_i1.p1 TRINITY_DN80613_c0_g1~~TRINITY_DN80613_c0_g1_i1.p1  ORF type:complete len:346 (-),score=74.14 TRINITY_DN80613_c0_g1_i1:104-1114(-)